MSDILPTVGYQVAFQATPSHATVPANEGFGDTDPPAWTDITDRVHHPAILRFGRGRSYEHGQIQPGTAEFTVDNTDGAFAPGNMLSPFHPWVIPGRRVRGTATWQGLTYPLFDCYVDSWGEAWPTRFAEWNLTEVACTDRLKQLARHRFQSALVEETTHLGVEIIGYWPLTEPADSRTRFGDNGLGFRPTGARQQDLTFRRRGTASAISSTQLPIVGAENEQALQLRPSVTDEGSWLEATLDRALPPSGSWAVSLWISDMLAGPARGLVILSGDADPGLALYVTNSLDSPPNTVRAVAGSGITLHNSAVTVTDGRPHHIALSYNSATTTLTLYVDGVDVASSSSGFTVPATRQLRVGVRRLLISGEFEDQHTLDGTIGHLALFAGSLNDLRIEAIHERGVRGLLTGEPANHSDGENTSVRALFLVNTYVDDLPAEIGLDDIIAPSDAGRVSVGHQGLLGRTAADLLAELGTAADGVNFIGPDGGLRTYSVDRRRRVPPKFTIDLTIDEIHGLDFYSDDQLLVNDLDYTGADGAVGNVQNLTSIEQFGRVRGQPLNLPLNLPSEAKRRAQTVVDRLGQPRPRTQTIQIDLRANPRLIHALLAVDLFDRFDMINLPDNAPAPSMAWLVEHLEHQVTDQSWLVAIQASPYDTELAAEDLMPVFNASGTYTKPAGLVAARVRETGGAGAGGGATATLAGEYSMGGGGGAGGYSEKIIAASALGATETVTVGAGGTGVSGAAGNAGGTSSFGTHLSAGGGAGGAIRGATATTTLVPAAGGNAGVGSNGDYNTPGGAGGHGSAYQAGIRGGDGGDSASAGGARGPISTAGGVTAAGNAAAANSGGGGSGAINRGAQSAQPGGAGGSGVVIVENNFGSGFE